MNYGLIGARLFMALEKELKTHFSNEQLFAMRTVIDKAIQEACVEAVQTQQCMQQERVLAVMNKLVAQLEPITLAQLRQFFPAKDAQQYEQLEREHPEVGFVKKDERMGINVIALLATLTDLCLGCRIAFQFDGGSNNDQITEEDTCVGVCWYKYDAELKK